MTKTNGKLAAARELMQRQRIFGPAEHLLFLQAAREEDFDAVGNVIDAKIEVLLDGLHGHPWRAHALATRDEDLYNEAERSKLMAAAAEVAAKQIVHDKAFDELLLAESVYRNPPETATIEMLRSFGVRHDKALRAFERARTDLEEAIPRVTAIKVGADRRRHAEALARLELHRQPSAAGG